MVSVGRRYVVVVVVVGRQVNQLIIRRFFPVMGQRFFTSFKFMPAGMIFTLSVVMVGLNFYSASGNRSALPTSPKPAK